MKIKVNVKRLFVRTKPSMKSDPVQILNYGNTFEVLEEEGNFYKIESGWVVKLYVEEVKEEIIKKRGRREVK